MTRWIAAIALLAAGCVSVPRPAPGVAQVPPPAPPQAPAPPPAKAPAPVVAASPPAAPQQPPATPAPKQALKPIPPAAPPKAPPLKAPAPTVTAKAPAATPPAAAPLDLKTLEERLRKTDAIGVMTKLSLKNQVDDLVDEFRAYYAGRSKASLGELRRPYDLLLMKVLTLLQDRDPPLARAVNASRDQIWSILSDREKFFSTLS